VGNSDGAASADDELDFERDYLSRLTIMALAVRSSDHRLEEMTRGEL
jgi:hypothetical protein